MEKSPKSPKKYMCEICNYRCSKNSELSKHLLTKKHIGNATGNKKISKYLFPCNNCNKEYKSNKGLWSHSKVCINNKNINEENINEENINDENMNDENMNEENMMNDLSNNDIKVLTNLVLELVKNNTELQKQNQEFQKQVLDVCKNIQPTTINATNNNNNSHNKTFNLQFFLNEQCKNAMNLNEFVDSFEFQVEDLLRIGRQGYVEGISHLIIEKLKSIDVYKRPIHCSDLRRDMLYIRTDDIWCKEGPEKNKISIAIKDIGKQNFPLLDEYRKLHPDCLEHNSEFNDPYVKLIMQAAGGCVKENVDKIIKNIMKQVVIEK